MLFADITEGLVREIGVSEETFTIFMELQLGSVSVRVLCKKCVFTTRDSLDQID